MDNLVNLTPFSAAALPSMDREGEELLLVVISGWFKLPRAGQPSLSAIEAQEEQPPVVLADEYWGDPTQSSLRHEGQSAYIKLGTDIQLNGHARAPRGRPTAQARLRVAVGTMRREALVFGDRLWTTGLLGLRPSRPHSFECIPIRYEYCFGGRPDSQSSAILLASQRNPVGRGLWGSTRDAIDRPLPNLEDPEAPIASPSDLPLPAGFGPIARHWLPRRQYAGTYDESWIRTRAPLWPHDLDERFFCAAPAGLCATPHLTGGELVAIAGAHPDGDFHFVLPRPRMLVKLTLRHRITRQVPLLDGLLIDTDAASISMIWRTAIHVGRDMPDLESILVRMLEPCEEPS